MAKNKKNSMGVQNPNSAGNKKEQLLEQMKEQQRAAKAKAAEEKWQELLAEMGEEAAKIFVSQVEVLAREDELKLIEKDIETRRGELDDRDKAIETKEKQQGENQQMLDEQKKQLDIRSGELDDRERAVKKQESDIEKRISALDKREQEILAREVNAENGFAKQSGKVLEALRKRKEELDGEILILEAEKIRRTDELDSQITGLREQRMVALDQEIVRISEQRKNEVEAEVAAIRTTATEVIASQKALLEDEKKKIGEEAAKLEEQRLDLEKKEREIKRAQVYLQFEQTDLESDRKQMEDTIKERLEVQSGEIQRQLKQAKEDTKAYKRRLEVCEEQLNIYEAQDRESGGLDRQQLLDKLSQAQTEIKSLKKEIHPDEALHAEYKAKASEYDNLMRQYTELLGRHADLELQKSQWILTVRQYDLAQQRLRAAEVERDALEASITRCQAEVDRLISLFDKSKNTDARKAPIEKPFFDLPEKASEGAMTEVEWLNRIYEKCGEADIKFGKRLLYSFHTALKTSGWSPITVLAGVSGTGKSLLPLLYSRFGGIYFVSMAVQPDWDSPQSLFGYFNAVDNKYNPTSLIQAMVQFGTTEEQLEKETNLSDYMMIVLLDEMNLAHVELYFSDMLSKLEQRRNSGENVVIDIDLGADAPKYPLELNDNILWVGTMNEDETTKSLSDKVLDRGNLISFPRPKEFVSKTQNILGDAAPMLPKRIWDEWVSASVIENKEFQDRIVKYKNGLQAINIAMGEAGRALGHRVWQSVENYMGNHPVVIEAVTAETIDSGACDDAMRMAFEEALVHKVMPKLRGIETDGITKTKCIDPIKEVLFGANGLAKGLEQDFKHAVDNTYETFLWSSAMYLETEER